MNVFLFSLFFSSSSQSVKVCKEVMHARQQSLMQQAFAHKKDGDSDAMSFSIDTSRWSTPSRLCCGSNTPHYSSEFEDETVSPTYKTPEAKSSDKWQESKPSGGTKGILLNMI